MKKLIALFLCGMVAMAALAGCNKETSSAGGAASTGGEASTPATGAAGNFRTVEEIQASGELIMLTNAAFEPYEYVQGGEVVGVDPDLARMIANELGVELVIIDMDFDLLVEALKGGRGDLIAAGMGYKPERAEQVDFSVQYVLNGLLIIVPEGSEITGPEDLDGMTIAVQEGTTANDYALDVVNGANVMSYKDVVAAGEAVATGRADCAIMDIKPAEGIVNNHEGLVILDTMLDDEDMCMAVGKGNTSLLEVVNAVLSEAKENGTIDQLVDFHMENSAN